MQRLSGQERGQGGSLHWSPRAGNQIGTCCHLTCWCEPWEGMWFHGMLISQTLVTSVTAHWTTKCEHTIWLTAVLCQRPSFLLFGLTEHSRHLQSSWSSDKEGPACQPADSQQSGRQPLKGILTHWPFFQGYTGKVNPFWRWLEVCFGGGRQTSCIRMSQGHCTVS